MVWRPALGPTCGVQFLPGFKDEERLPSGDAPPPDLEGEALIAAMEAELHVKANAELAGVRAHDLAAHRIAGLAEVMGCSPAEGPHTWPDLLAELRLRLGRPGRWEGTDGDPNPGLDDTRIWVEPVCDPGDSEQQPDLDDVIAELEEHGHAEACDHLEAWWRPEESRASEPAPTRETPPDDATPTNHWDRAEVVWGDLAAMHPSELSPAQATLMAGLRSALDRCTPSSGLADEVKRLRSELAECTVEQGKNWAKYRLERKGAEVLASSLEERTGERDALLAAAAALGEQRDHLLGGLTWAEATADNPMEPR